VSRSSLAERQRKPSAEPDDLVDRGRRPVNGIPAQPLPQQVDGLVVGEHLERNWMRALGRDHPGELVAAGDDDHAARAGRQQRPDLTLRTGVVQHHEQPLAVHQATEEPDPPVERFRHPGAGDP
jgi:hypothetical protein